MRLAAPEDTISQKFLAGAYLRAAQAARSLGDFFLAEAEESYLKGRKLLLGALVDSTTNISLKNFLRIEPNSQPALLQNENDSLFRSRRASK